MGNLTNDMARLRGEVDALRVARGALMQDLTRGAKERKTAVEAMRAEFTSAHAAMAKQNHNERVAFVTAVTGEVDSLLATFSRHRHDMARKGKKDRRAFVAGIRRLVVGMCKDTADDLLGARLAWCGQNPGMSRFVPMKEKPAAIKPEPHPAEVEAKVTETAPEIQPEMRATATTEIDPREETRAFAINDPPPHSAEETVIEATKAQDDPLQNQSRNPEEKTGKTAPIKAKRGTKHSRGGF